MGPIRADRATGRAREVAWRAALALLIAIPAFVAGARLVQGGLPALLYDECEYARQMLQTADQLFRRGLLVWPEVIALHQPYAKPPLLVDVAAGFLLLFGRSRAPYAIAATMATTTLLTSLVVFRLVRDLFSARAAVVALLALGAIPAYGLYTARFFPEPLVTLLLFLLLAQLFARRSPVGRTLALGLTFGAGLLAKATFPALSLGPLGVCWLMSGRAPADAKLAGRGVIAGGVAVGLLVAALWYADNLGPAITHARYSYGFTTRSLDSGFAIARAWLGTIVKAGLGVGGCALVVVALVLAARWFRRDRTDVTSTPSERPSGGESPFAFDVTQWTFLVALLSVALPSILAALPSPNASPRILLPAFGALGVAASIVVAEARPTGALRAARWFALALVAIQWLAVQIGGLSSSSVPRQAIPLGPVAGWLNPYPGPLQQIATDPLERLLHATFDLAPRAKISRGALAPVLFFVGNYPELDLSRFALYQVGRESSVRLRWLCYFDWSPEHRAAALGSARGGQSIVVSYRRKRPGRAATRFLNRHTDECLRAVRDPANGFRLVRDLSPEGGGYELELYANFELPDWP